MFILPMRKLRHWVQARLARLNPRKLNPPGRVAARRGWSKPRSARVSRIPDDVV